MLHDVRHGVPFDVALRRAIRDLEPDDKRLAHELAAGVFRHRSALDSALRPKVDRGLDRVRADARDVLRIGAFQLLHLDRVPPHAAVQTTVGVARRLGGRRVAGFVNAVLRRVADEVEAPQAGGTARDDLATRHSHPRWLVDRWLARFGPEEAERLLQWNNATPPVALQPARWSQAELEERLRAAGVAFEPAPRGAGLLVRGRRPVDLPGFADGGFYVQDPAQRMVADFFAIPEGATVYDACAAPGGKSLAAARTARLVIAADRHKLRIRRLAQNVRRAGTGRIEPVVAAATRPPIRAADVVLLDVPCLTTGTLARNPDARWRLTPAALQSLVAQAEDFLEVAAQVVAPDGLLLFATCSLEPEENEAQIDRFLGRHPEFRREPGAATPPDLLTPNCDLMILPQRHGTDGAYAARLRRIGPPELRG